ncbi:MAG TPA: hypothetical protein VLI90_09880, partial [Tepidisphaeraceae bacterium]|nr:hypothetical protein [Tepidisphaeraceae bacterium]
MAAWAAIGAAVAASGSAADAQVQPLVNSGGPIVLGEQHEKPDAVHFDPVTGSVNLLARYDANTSDQGSTHERAAESLFEETATVESGGYVYHPNIFSFHVGVTGGLSQQLFDSSNASPQTDKTGFDSLYGWDISGTFLRNEYAPLTLYTRRFEQFIQRDFSPSERSTSTTYGANLDIRSRIVPTTFQVYHSDDTLTSLAPGVGYDLTQNVAQWHSEADPTANQKLIWDASFNNTYQAPNIGPSFTINSGDANLSHDISFGKDKASSLLSSINYTNQTGDIAFNRLRWSESLRLKHSEQFLTQYNYAFDRESFQGSEQTNHRLNAGFVHHLFESLTTSGNVGGALTDLGSGGNIEQFFSSLGFDYRKNVPFGVLL